MSLTSRTDAFRSAQDSLSPFCVLESQRCFSCLFDVLLTKSAAMGTTMIETTPSEGTHVGSSLRRKEFYRNVSRCSSSEIDPVTPEIDRGGSGG